MPKVKKEIMAPKFFAVNILKTCTSLNENRITDKHILKIGSIINIMDIQQMLTTYVARGDCERIGILIS